MDLFPFQTYPEAVKHFSFAVPAPFYETLKTIKKYCNDNGYDTMDVLSNLFEIVQLTGDEMRYQQTPIELFPFASPGWDGIHYGFLVHMEGQNDYPTGMLEPMDTQGLILIGENNRSTFQTLLTNDEESMEQHAELLAILNLKPGANELHISQRTEKINIHIPGRKDWIHMQTDDGAGIYTEKKFFHDLEELNNLPSYERDSFNEYADMARKMEQQGYYASQLFFLKQLFWHEWPNYEIATDLLKQMLTPYEKLGRPHLHMKTKEVIDTFVQHYLGR